MVKDARVNVVLQRIEEPVGDEVKVEPTHIRRYGVNNIFQRTFAYLFGWTDEGKPLKLACTSAGWLKVATTAGTVYEHVERKAGIAVAAKSSFIAFTNGVGKVDIVVQNYEMWFITSTDGVSEEGAIRCLPGIRNTFEITTTHFKVQRADVNDVEYEVLGIR